MALGIDWDEAQASGEKAKTFNFEQMRVVSGVADQLEPRLGRPQGVWRGQSTDWLVRAVGPSTTEVLQPYFETDDGQTIELLIAKEAKRRQERHRSHPVRNEFWFSFPHGNKMRAAVNHETGIAPHKQQNDKEVAKAAATPVPEESDKEMESSTDDTKRRKQRPLC